MVSSETLHIGVLSKMILRLAPLSGSAFEQCNALHNAIGRYGQLRCGHDLSDLSKQTR
jgi:hypothetical protein